MIGVCFWLNSPSPHLAGIIKELSLYESVCVVSPMTFKDDRLELGWTLPDFGNAQHMEISDVNFDDVKCAINIFSGFNEYQTSKAYFDRLYYSGAKTYVMLEKPNTNGLFGKLRYIKYFLKSKKYSKVHGFISHGADNFLRRIGVKEQRILSFAYFSDYVFTGDPFLKSEVQYDNDSSHNLLYIGSLTKNKNIESIIKAIPLLSCNVTLNIVGCGDEANSLRNLVNFMGLDHCVRFHGMIPYSDKEKFYSEAEVVFITSKHDGWCVVSNEALLSGCKLVLSERCGSYTYFNNLPQVEPCDPDSVMSIVEAAEKLINSKLSVESIKDVDCLLCLKSAKERLCDFISC